MANFIPLYIRLGEFNNIVVVNKIYNNSLSVEKYITFDCLSRLSTTENLTFPLILYILIKHTNLYFGHTFLTHNVKSRKAQNVLKTITFIYCISFICMK